MPCFCRGRRYETDPKTDVPISTTCANNWHRAHRRQLLWVEGIFGEALEFDGATGWVDAGNAPGLAPSPMSCMFWMKPSKELGLDDPRANIVYYALGPMFAFNKTPVADEPLGPPNTIRSLDRYTR